MNIETLEKRQRDFNESYELLREELVALREEVDLLRGRLEVLEILDGVGVETTRLSELDDRQETLPF